jgi:DNA-binding beta-propeller fold protein YncE
MSDKIDFRLSKMKPIFFFGSVTVLLALVVAGAPGCRTINADPAPDSGAASSTSGSTSGATNEDGGVAPTRLEPAIVHAAASITVTTVAGSGLIGGDDGKGVDAKFANPVGVVVEPSGSLLITEYEGGRLRRLALDGTTTTLTTGLQEPFGVVVTKDAIYVQTDRDPQGAKNDNTGTLWKIPLAGGTPELAATGLGRPRGLAESLDGKIILSDRRYRIVSLYDPVTKGITFLAGGLQGLVDGNGNSARFREPYGVALLPDGSLVVVDRENHVLRRVTNDGDVTVFAGEGVPGMKDDVDKLKARFDIPCDVVSDPAGNLFVSDAGNHRIRRISSTGEVETIAGDGTEGFQDGEGIRSKFFAQEQIDITPDGKTIYVADGTGGDPDHPPFNRIRKISLP